MINISLHLQYHSMVEWLQSNPHWGWIIAFLAAFAESIAIIGSIVPGTITMTAIGLLIGSSVMPLWITLTWAILGAILGDALSFFIGRFFKNDLTKIWPFKKHPAILEKGQAFVQKHGGKSIFIGRFVGPVRAIVPLITGMLDMRPKFYFIASIPAAILWAPLYMLPGILIGAISLEMPADIATELILSVFFILIIFWGIIKCIAYLYRKTHRYFSTILDKKWEKWQTQRSKKWLCHLLRHAERATQRGQILLFINTLITLSIFLIIFVNVIYHGSLTHWNDAVYHLFRGIRSITLDNIAVIFTMLGLPTLLSCLIFLMFIWFLFCKRWRIAFHWLTAGIIGSALTILFKHFYFSPRPWGLIKQSASSSFPSGHTTMAVITYGLLAFFLTQKAPKTVRSIIYWVATLLCIAIGMSRLYLGAHWLTDVVGGIFLGLSIIGATVISYYRYASLPAPRWSTMITAILTITVLTIGYASVYYANDLYNYQRYWPLYQISYQSWWTQRSPAIPQYRADRLGHPTEILNIQWAGSLKNIRQTLENNDWQGIHTRDYLTTLKKLAEQNHRLAHSVIPKLYDDRNPVLEMAKLLNGQFPPLIIRLWRSNIYITPNDTPLWVGTIYYDVTEKQLLFFNRTAKTKNLKSQYLAIRSDLKKSTGSIKQLKQKNLPLKLANSTNSTLILIATH